MTELQYPVVINRLSDEDGGGYLASAPDLPGCMGDGATPEAAVADLRDAIAEWIDEAKRLNRVVPSPGEGFERTHQRWREVLEAARQQEQLVVSLSPQESEKIKLLLEHLRRRIIALAEAAEKDQGDRAAISPQLLGGGPFFRPH